MRIQTYILLVLASLYLWIAAFEVTRQSYRTAQAFGIMPNLEIGERIRGIF